MNYIDKGYIKVNISPIILLGKLLFLILMLDILAIIILFIDYAEMLSKGHNGFSTEEYFFLGLLIVQFMLIIILFMKWLYKFYVFKDNKLIYYSGIVFKKKQEFILDKIGSTHFEQSFLGTIFNYGNIIIYIGNENFQLTGISNPNGFMKMLSKFEGIK